MTWPSAVAARFFPTFKNILKLRLKNVQIGYVISVCLCLVTCGYTYVCTICQRQVELEAPSLQGHTRVTRLHRRRHPCTCPRCGIHTGAYAHTYLPTCLHIGVSWGALKLLVLGPSCHRLVTSASRWGGGSRQAQIIPAQVQASLRKAE